MQTSKNSLSNIDKANNVKRNCIHCDKEVSLANINKHEKACGRPKILKSCPVCGIDHSKGGITCSYSCSNSYFRSGENNPNWKGKYQSVCFAHHEKKCVVCGEDKIVAVHHYDHNHENNDPKNLIPLCPTHHAYVHSRYANEVLPYIEKYKLGVG